MGDRKQRILDGETYLGIELGSTRIKLVLIDEACAPVASSSYEWESKLENGIWTYHLDEVWKGLQTGFQKLSEEVAARYGAPLSKLKAVGISAMMHGYLVFDKDENQLVPFRTWRTTTTEQAAEILTKRLNFNIPIRWNVAHLYQAILNGEEHVSDIAYLTTLAGYVHWKLTGEKVLGVGDASGMFPIDSATGRYDQSMVGEFDRLIADKNFGWKLEEILPHVLRAGEPAGTLTESGAKLLDPTGGLQSGIPMCPPEGDAGTGMVATNSISERTGNVSAGTSIFAMVVLEKALSKVYPEIDMVTTPDGKPVAMVHCNNCTSDIDAWVRLFREAIEATGGKVAQSNLYGALYAKALEGDSDCGGLLSYNYYAGEPITGFTHGRPLFVRTPDSNFTLANFMRTQLFSTVASLKIGMDILTENEHVRLERLLGHGGLFKTKGVGQQLMATALNVPVAVMESAGEGGAWGIAILAAFMEQSGEHTSLDAFLAKVFAEHSGTCLQPDSEDIHGFESFMKRYKKGLAIEAAAVEYLNYIA